MFKIKSQLQDKSCNNDTKKSKVLDKSHDYEIKKSLYYEI